MMKRYVFKRTDGFHNPETDRWFEALENSKRTDLTEEFVLENINELVLRKVLANNVFEERFLRKLAKATSWNDILRFQPVSMDLIIDVYGELSYNEKRNLVRGQKLPEDFLRDEFHELNTLTVFRCQSLSNEFLSEFKSHIPWRFLDYSSTFTEENVRAFLDFVDWEKISVESGYSDQFYFEFIDRLNLVDLSFNANVSKVVRKLASDVYDLNGKF